MTTVFINPSGAPGSQPGVSGHDDESRRAESPSLQRSIPAEADWRHAPSLMEGARNLQLTPAACNLDYWFTAVAAGTLAGLVNGHTPRARTPDYMRVPGPLREALMNEFAFRAIAEEKATRAISYLVANAPDLDTMEFFATQLIDEGRHSRVFRAHLLEMGVPENELFATIHCISGEDARIVLEPLEDFALPMMRDQRDFIAGVIVLTVLVEGVLAPAAELSERKWRLLDPAAAEIERANNIDEIRHLTVGSAVVRQHLLRHPEEKRRILGIIRRGRALWAQLPTADVIMRREMLFQKGMQQHAEVIGDYELTAGLRLLDTTPEIRLGLAHEWSMEMQNSRLEYMGLPEARL
jgi:hypothetical protein